MPHYAEPLTRRLVVPFAPLRSAPREDAAVISELLAGEGFGVLDIAGAWAWGACAHDGYLGYLPLACLGDAAPAPAAAGDDPVATARAFIGQPFVLGGRGGAGFDSAGLVQRAYANQRLPRDWDQQAASVGRALPLTATLQAGDLLFREGLAAIYAGADRVVFADPTAGAVIERELAEFAHTLARRVMP